MLHVIKRCLAVAVLSSTALGGLSLPGLAQTLTVGTRAGPESVDPHYTASGTHA